MSNKMTQGFDEFYDGLELQCLNTQEVGELCFEAGAASRQVEIDELRKRIDDALQFTQDSHSDLNIGMLKMVQILKGESNE